MPLERGLIQVYTSPQGEFNYAPLGLALRAAGRNLKNLIIRFSTHEMDQGYSIASSHLSPFLKSPFIDLQLYGNNEQLNRSSVADIVQGLLHEIEAGTYDLIHVLGVDKALTSGIIDQAELIRKCVSKARHLELVLSGISVPSPIINMADLVTKMIVRGPKQSKELESASSGSVEVVTGNGKGKTTYGLGKALLASSLSVPCLFLQFIKSPLQYGETIAINRLPNCTIKTMGKGFIFPKNGIIEQKHRYAAKMAWEEFSSQLSSTKFKLIVLDEINIAINYNLLDPYKVAEVINDKPPGTHLILTGRNTHPAIIESAHKVIEMEEIKHPFRKGIKARKGIEF